MTTSTHPAKQAALASMRKATPGTSTQAQCQRIKAALAQFGIITFEAMRHLDCHDARAHMMHFEVIGRIKRIYKPTSRGML